MKRSTSSHIEAVQHPFAPPQCSLLRDARRTPWRMTQSTAVRLTFAIRIPCRPPPPVLLAPGTACFSTTASVPNLGKLRHLAVQLTCPSASRAGLSVSAQEDAAAGYSDHLDELRRLAGPGAKVCSSCGDEFELYCFPSDSSSPDRRHHYCYPCRAEFASKNLGLPRRTPSAESGTEHRCSKCGLLREARWFSMHNLGFQRYCKPCSSNVSKVTQDRHQRAREKLNLDIASTEARTKACCVCREVLPLYRFAKRVGGKDGLQRMCRPCDMARIATRRENRSLRARSNTLEAATGMERVCTQCECCKPWDAFYKRTSANSGISTICKACTKASAALHRPLQDDVI